MMYRCWKFLQVSRWYEYGVSCAPCSECVLRVVFWLLLVPKISCVGDLGFATCGYSWLDVTEVQRYRCWFVCWRCHMLSFWIHVCIYQGRNHFCQAPWSDMLCGVCCVSLRCCVNSELFHECCNFGDSYSFNVRLSGCAHTAVSDFAACSAVLRSCQFLFITHTGYILRDVIAKLCVLVICLVLYMLDHLLFVLILRCCWGEVCLAGTCKRTEVTRSSRRFD